MADNNKGKTKAAILHELESIKGLLREEDEIPILQEMIAGAGNKPGDRPLPKRDLDELHDVFQALSHNIKTSQGQTPPSKPAPRPQGALDTFTRQQTQKTVTPVTQPPARQQSSLFSDDMESEAEDDFDQDYLSEDTVDSIEPTIGATRESTIEPTREPTKEPTNLESSDRSGGDEDDASINIHTSLNYAVSKSITPPRSALAKASGENPFLPQHIRARLHGNNPPPLFDLADTEKPPLAPFSRNPLEISTRQQLIRDLVAAVIPQVEQDLRQRLQAMTDEQLQELLRERE